MTTSTKQMKARMHRGHRHVLECVRDGKSIDFPGCPMGELRGYMKSRDTLCQWGAIDRNGITDIGKELLV